MFKQDYVILDFNFAGSPERPVQILEVGAVRLNNKNTVLGKYESIVRLTNIPIWDEATWKEHGLEYSEISTAPELSVIISDLLKFCNQAELTGWTGHDIICAVRMMVAKDFAAKALYWAYTLDLRSYLIGKYGKPMSRKFKLELEKHNLDTRGIERPLVRCQKLIQLLEVLQDIKPDRGGKEPFRIYEV